jgi:hypothetical protein
MAIELEYASPQSKSFQRWIADNPFLVAGVVYVLGNFIQLLFAKPANSEWQQVFVYSAKLLLEGGDIYGPGINQFQLNHPYTYPPFHALIGIPFVYLPQLISRIAWFAVQVAALMVLLRLSWKVSGGRELNRGKWSAMEAAICALGLLAGIRYIQGVFGHQQSDILIDAFLVAGCFAWQWGRDFLAASAWAIAAAFKGPPLIMAGYLAWRGRWLPAAWMVLLAIALNLVPDCVDRTPRGIWLDQWYTRIVKPTSNQIGAWYVDVTINQSIAGAAHRFFTTDWKLSGKQLIVTSGKAAISDRAGKLVVYGVDATLLLAAGLAMRRPFHRPPDSRTAGLECTLMFILMLLLSPMSHKTHFGLLVLPGFFVARGAIEGRDWVCAVCMLICVIVIGLLDHFFLYPALGDLFAWYGNITLGTIALGIACWHFLFSGSKTFSAPGPASV